VLRKTAASLFSRQEGKFKTEMMKVFCLEAGIKIASNENMREIFCA